MKGDAMRPPLRIRELKHFRALGREADLVKRNQNYAVLGPVVIPQLKAPAGEFMIPPDAVQQLVNGNHRMFEQQFDQVFAKLTAALRSSVATPAGFLHTAEKPPGLVVQSRLFVELRQGLIPLHNIEARAELELAQGHRATPMLEPTAPNETAEIRTALRRVTI